MGKLSDYEYRKQPGFDMNSFAGEESLNYDIKLLRSSPAVPKHIKLYGFFYEISTGKLTEVVRDIPV